MKSDLFGEPLWYTLLFGVFFCLLTVWPFGITLLVIGTLWFVVDCWRWGYRKVCYFFDEVIKWK